jgi:hypothetical protein
MVVKICRKTQFKYISLSRNLLFWTNILHETRGTEISCFNFPRVSVISHLSVKRSDQCVFC